MTPASQPRAPWPSDDDDELTRVMQRAPASLGGVAISCRPPALPQEAAPKARRFVLGALGLGLAAGICVLAAPQLGTSVKDLVARSAVQEAAAATAAPQAAAAQPVAAAAARESAAAARESAAAVDAPLADEDRADAPLERVPTPIAGGVVAFPASFGSADGQYDLVIHFHGLHQIVTESFEHAGLNAVVAVINLGIGSGAYANMFSGRSSLPGVLAQTQSVLAKRGLRDAKLRRLAISAFSAGYGAARGILSQPAFAEQVDAVLLLDGLHTGYMPRDHSLDIERLTAFQQFAEKAVNGQKLFTLTHSEIIPNADYASTHESTDALLALLGVERQDGGELPAVPALTTMKNVERIAPLAPLTEAHQGSFHVRGYAGTQKADHIMHLAQMSETAVPDLVRRWSEPEKP